MKKILYTFLSIIATLFIISTITIGCGPNTKEAVNYNDSITKIQENLMKEIIHLDELFDNDVSIKTIEKQHKIVLESICLAIEKIEQTKSIDENEMLKNAAIKLFTNYKTLVAVKYQKLIEIYQKTEENRTVDEQMMMDEMPIEIMEKMSEYHDNFTIVQKEFAHKYDFMIE